MKILSSLFASLLLFCHILGAQEKPVYQVTKLTDNIYELSADGGGYPVKVIASVGDDGLLIVDSGEKENGTALVDALKSFNKGLPKYVINTHSHIEHLGGNVALGNGPTYIGHENLRDRYTNGLYIFNEIPDSVLPNLTFTDSMSVFFNGEEIKLIAYPGVVFRMTDQQNYERVYLRPHRSGLYGDALQYVGTFNGLDSWKLFSGEGKSSRRNPSPISPTMKNLSSSVPRWIISRVIRCKSC